MTQKWANNGAGRIQCKRFNDAWGKLNWENKTFVELTGVIGKDERSSTLTNLFGTTVRADVEAVKDKIGAQFNWTVTAENANQIVKAIEAELPALETNRPIKDLRKLQRRPQKTARRSLRFTPSRPKKNARTTKPTSSCTGTAKL